MVLVTFLTIDHSNIHPQIQFRSKHHHDSNLDDQNKNIIQNLIKNRGGPLS